MMRVTSRWLAALVISNLLQRPKTDKATRHTTTTRGEQSQQEVVNTNNDTQQTMDATEERSAGTDAVSAL